MQNKLNIHKEIKTLRQDKDKEILFAHMKNKQIIEVPFDKFKDGSSFVLQRIRLHQYILANYKEYINKKDSKGNRLYAGDKVHCQGGSFYNGYWEYDDVFEIIKKDNVFLLKNEEYKTNFYCFDNIVKIHNYGDLK